MLISCAVGVTLLWLLANQGRTNTHHPAKTTINWHGYKRLKAGMSAAQVEFLLGCPPGNYGSADPGLTSTSKVRYWIDDELALGVWFRADGTMFGKQIFIIP